MLTEECHMNEFLMSKGIDVVESDLGERYLAIDAFGPEPYRDAGDPYQTGADQRDDGA